MTSHVITLSSRQVVRGHTRGFWIVMLWICSLGCAGPATAEELFLAPEEHGDVSGRSPEDALPFGRDETWDRVRHELQEGPVTVTLLPGEYLIRPMRLDRIGHPDHALVIEPQAAASVTFRRDPNDDRINDAAFRPTLLEFTRARNLTLRGLHFSGSETMGYALRFRNSLDISIVDCRFVDLPGVFYGAVGTVGNCRRISIDRCTFQRVGSSGRAHMIYNAYGPQEISITRSVFQDCAGDFIRFRDRVSDCVVTDNTFEQTTAFVQEMRPFISIPLFNDDDPAADPQDPRYEAFGRNFRIERNRFVYELPPGPVFQPAVLFWAKGFSPPGSRHLLSPAETRIFRSMDTAQQRQWLMERSQLDIASLRMRGNDYVHVDPVVAFFSEPAYGSESQDNVVPIWLDITDLADHQ